LETNRPNKALWNISRYQKTFGTGPVGFLAGLLLLGLLWLLDRTLGHVEILSRPGPIRILGWMLIAVWVCWHAWCVKTISSWWNKSRLCTTGPYRFVRHPMYAGGALLFGYGVALILNSWIFLLWPVLWCFILSALVRKEERMMEAVFGDEYRRYAARTGRILPQFFRK
jgi:protein-S-isoprenylcysteine O-methyltransferase Ste14